MSTELLFTCKCIACDKKFTLTLAQTEACIEAGCAISPCCNFPSTVEKAAYSRVQNWPASAANDAATHAT